MENVKNAVRSQWNRVKPVFQKHGDILLVALALAVLAGGVIRYAGKMKITHTETPGIVFTQWWEEDTENGCLQSLADEFESLHDGIKVTINYMPYEEMKEKFFEPAISDGSDGERAPDICALDPLWVPEQTKAPLVSFINVLFYNVDILKEAGFSRPPKTRGEFLEYARTITGKDENCRGLAMGLYSQRGVYDDVYPWIYSAGARLTGDKKPAANSRRIIECLTFLTALYNENLITQDALSADSEKKLENFVSGRAAFMIAPSSDIERVRKLMGDEAFSVSAVPPPDNYAGKFYYAGAGWTTGINPASARREEAGLFADFLAEKAAFLSEAARAIPGNGAPPPRDPFYSKVWDIAIAGEYAPDFTGLPWNEMESIFRKELTSLFAGTTTPAETAGAIQKEWENITDICIN